MSVITVDLKQQNSLVCSENVTYHIFSGKKTHCNQTGGCDWTRDETKTVLLQCGWKIQRDKNLIRFIQLYLYCCYNIAFPSETQGLTPKTSIAGGVTVFGPYV